jgi:hypothetical protein
MNIKKIEANGHIIATANADSIVLTDEQSALDIIMTISSKTGSNRIVLNKEAILEEFLSLVQNLQERSFKNLLITILNLQS